MKKTKIYLTEAEWRLVIHSLSDFRNKLLQEGQYTDIVDEVMLKTINAPVKKVKATALLKRLPEIVNAVSNFNAI